jgi:hypothetical protein
MENLKHTKEYADELANKTYPSKTTAGYNDHWSATERRCIAEGYMKAIEETGVSDLLEALIEANKLLQLMRDNGYSISSETLSKQNNAINKATK